MEIIQDVTAAALVGIAIDSKIIYNIVEQDGEFDNTGLSIINYLKTNRNGFISNIFASQSYNGIKLLLDDKMLFNGKNEHDNINIDSYGDTIEKIESNANFDFIYIYDLIQDLLLIKTPQNESVIALNYNNSTDVRNFINTIKQGN
jgi:hypothetical protein